MWADNEKARELELLTTSKLMFYHHTSRMIDTEVKEFNDSLLGLVLPQILFDILQFFPFGMGNDY